MTETKDRKVPIDIEIAGFPMSLEVKISDQDHIRDTEKRVNAIFLDWEKRYPRKTAAQLLAMLTFRFASFYYSLRDRDEALVKDVEELNKRLDDLIDGTVF